MTNLQRRFIRLLISLALLSICASTQTPTPVAPVSNPCAPRFAAGSVVSNPPAVFSFKWRVERELLLSGDNGFRGQIVALPDD
jgi:hypothetical protein